ncbi:MAG: phage tail assembly chaperone [Hyphomonas sp.]|uniref:phage tail assembly chaperone n=1 Tax=Hyphomonas sp. TaxID=87 RepID=UPI003527AAB7
MLPWGVMLRAAIATGIGPEAFWRLSLREWRWLSGDQGGLSRGTLMMLMSQYPDEQGEGDGRV